MQKLSNINLITRKEQGIQNTCSETGLSKEIVTKLYESNDLFGGFENLKKPQRLMTAKEFGELFIGNNTTNEDFVKMLELHTNRDAEHVLDSVGLLTVVRDMLVKRNPQLEEIFADCFGENFTKPEVISNLNESVIIQNFDVVQLYEGLSQILSRNESRWSHSYHIQNAHDRIKQWIDSEITRIQIEKDVKSFDSSVNQNIINNFLSGNLSPLYADFSSVKHLIDDNQTLIFDMILLINRFIYEKEYQITFISQQSVNAYKNSANQLLGMLYSSYENSLVLSDEFKKVLRTKKYDGDGWNPLNGYEDILENFTNNIDTRKLIERTVHIKPVADMGRFIASATFDYNLKIRPVMRHYATQVSELVFKINQIKTN